MIFDENGIMMIKFMMDNFKTFIYSIDRVNGHVALGSSVGQIKIIYVDTSLKQFKQHITELQTLSASPTGIKLLKQSNQSQ